MSAASFFCVQLFDHEGYFGVAMGATPEEVKKVAARRSANQNIVACSLPFAGAWSGKTRDVSAPPDFKEVLSALEKPERE